MMSIKITKKPALSLTEVLISLSIIGVITALTVPALLSNTSDGKLRLQWRHNFNQIKSSYNQTLFPLGGNFFRVCPNGSPDSRINCVSDNLTRSLSILRTCNPVSTASNTDCLYDTANGDLRLLNGSLSPHSWYTRAYVLNNGAILWIGTDNNNARECDGVYNNSNVRNVCGYFMIDVNGRKQPNTVGRDVYHGWITQDKILPVGALDETNSAATLYNASSCNSGGEGWGCSARFLNDEND